MNWPDLFGEINLLSEAYQKMASVYSQVGSLEERMENINISIQLETNFFYLASRYIQKAELYFSLGKYDSCHYYYEKVRSFQIDDLSINTILADGFSRIEEKKGNYKNGLFYRSQYISYMDSIRKNTRTKELAELYRKYDLSVVKNENNQLKIARQRRDNLILWIVIFSFILIEY